MAASLRHAGRIDAVREAERRAVDRPHHAERAKVQAGSAAKHAVPSALLAEATEHAVANGAAGRSLDEAVALEAHLEVVGALDQRRAVAARRGGVRDARGGGAITAARSRRIARPAELLATQVALLAALEDTAVACRLGARLGAIGAVGPVDADVAPGGAVDLVADAGKAADRRGAGAHLAGAARARDPRLPQAGERGLAPRRVGDAMDRRRRRRLGHRVQAVRDVAQPPATGGGHAGIDHI